MGYWVISPFHLLIRQPSYTRKHCPPILKDNETNAALHPPYPRISQNGCGNIPGAIPGNMGLDHFVPKLIKKGVPLKTTCKLHGMDTVLDCVFPKSRNKTS